MLKNFKKLIPFSTKARFWLYLFMLRSVKSFPFIEMGKEGPRVFIFLAADYGNLGDVAITYAQHKFLQKTFPEFRVTEIPISKTLEGIAYVKKIITPRDIITTVGGGNMGDLYPMIEHFRQLVIRKFPDHPIISFPQTIDFSSTKNGKKALKNAIEVYGKHKNLTLLAREQKTFDFFQAHFTENKSLLVPDIVMSLDRSKPQFPRKGALICLREDKERRMTTEEQIELLKLIESKFGSYKKRDTHIGGDRMSLFTRVKALFGIWDDFKSAELVVTDRLHGMIFCYITKTPALVFLNNNHKVESCYHWIKNARWITLIDTFSPELIQQSIESITADDNTASEVSLEREFKELSQNLISS